jgi:hypothetical protein
MASFKSLRAAACCALAIHSAQAAEEPQRDARPQAFEEILVTGHSQDELGTSDAASAGRITRQRVEDRPLLRPGEILELVPGLIVTQHSGAGKANQFFLRGFNLDHGTDFATALDGVPLNLRTHAHGQGYTDLNFVIPELVERVDYRKGPYFASKGDFASAGAADIRYATSLPKNLVEVTLGTFMYGRTLFAGAPAVAKGSLLYGLELFHDDGPWNHADDYRRLNGVLRYSQKSGNARWGVTAMGYYGLWNATDQIPLRSAASGEIDRYSPIDPTDGGRTYRFSLSGDYQAEAGGGVFQASAYAVRYKLNLFSDFTYFLDDPVRGDQFEQADDRWRGVRDEPVRRSHHAATGGHRAGVHLVDTQHLERSARADDVDDRVEPADLAEVHLRRWPPVQAALDLG